MTAVCSKSDSEDECSPLLMEEVLLSDESKDSFNSSVLFNLSLFILLVSDAILESILLFFYLLLIPNT